MACCAPEAPPVVPFDLAKGLELRPDRLTWRGRLVLPLKVVNMTAALVEVVVLLSDGVNMGE